MFFYENKNVVMTTERIKKHIEIFQTRDLPRLEKLKRYYDSKNDTIMNRTFADTTKPNYRISNSWGDYIANISSNYFIGKPVTYNASDAEMLTELNAIFKFNDEMTINNVLALNQSIYGYSTELLYLDENSNVRFAPVDVRNLILIFENTIEQNLLYAIRFYKEADILTDKTVLNVELYSETEIKYFVEIQGVLTLIDSKEHFFNGVPINVYRNNVDCMGDYEKLLPLIDAYDLAQSDSSNERESFNEAYLVFRNTNLDNSDILTMKETRNIIIEDTENGMQSSVDFLVKNGNPTESEANKTRIADDIHKFSYVEDMSGANAKSHTSATGARLSMLGLEQVMARKEANFRFALTRRIELICNLLNLKGASYDFRSISIAFVRNIPVDNVLVADTISKLRGLVSDETLLEQLPFITDIEQELKRLEAQNSLNSYTNLFGGVEDEQPE
ncbi:MAG: phage portal protein [Sedimentibacter sp.]|uniref:phage portal protein n=1 Tax=Sedimentibacter sp. TaxID=1960295 RepID=UPI00315921BF